MTLLLLFLLYLLYFLFDFLYFLKDLEELLILIIFRHFKYILPVFHPAAFLPIMSFWLRYNFDAWNILFIFNIYDIESYLRKPSYLRVPSIFSYFFCYMGLLFEVTFYIWHKIGNFFLHVIVKKYFLTFIK